MNSLFGAFAATIHGAFVILACIVIASIGFGIALTVFAAHAESLIVLGIVAYAVAQYQRKSNHKVGKHELHNSMPQQSSPVLSWGSSGNTPRHAAPSPRYLGAFRDGGNAGRHSRISA